VAKAVVDIFETLNIKEQNVEVLGRIDLVLLDQDAKHVAKMLAVGEAG